MTGVLQMERAAGGPPRDLAELFAEFNEVTARLQATHEMLTAKTARLEEELREATRQLRRSRELAALGEMAAGIAHEVRNPLGSIGLYAAMLGDDLADRPEQQSVARKIGDAVRGLDRVVGDVLTFARELRLRTGAVEVDAMLSRAVEACRAHARGLGVEIVIESGSVAEQEIECDAGLMQQALINVVRNACEATARSGGGGGGGETGGVDAVRRRGRESDGASRRMVSLRVRDDGPGIPPEVMERMFNPFFTTREAGTGLGLAIVHRIVDAHGGRVAVGNRSEGGASVELLLPERSADRMRQEVTKSQGVGA